jgi:hypothetical protein
VIPKGLIRYASEDEIEKKEPFKFTLQEWRIHRYFGHFSRNLIGLLFYGRMLKTTTIVLSQRDNTVIFYL